MSDRFDVEFLEVGDSFEGGPVEQSYFISAIMAAGGEVQINGNRVLILQLPKKTKAVPAPVAEEPVAEEPVAEEPVAEEPVAEEPVAEEPVAEEPVAEVFVAPRPPATRRKTKAVLPPKTVEE